MIMKRSSKSGLLFPACLFLLRVRQNRRTGKRHSRVRIKVAWRPRGWQNTDNGSLVRLVAKRKNIFHWDQKEDKDKNPQNFGCNGEVKCWDKRVGSQVRDSLEWKRQREKKKKDLGVKWMSSGQHQESHWELRKINVKCLVQFQTVLNLRVNNSRNN